MTTVEQEIHDILSEVQAVIVDRMTSEGVTATGKSMASLCVDVAGGHGVLAGGSWWEDIERGHPAGREVDIADLEDWAAARNYKGDVPSLAAKLETMGSAAWAMGGRMVFSDDVQKMVDTIPSRLGDAVATYLTRFILETKPTAAQMLADDDEIPF